MKYNVHNTVKSNLTQVHVFFWGIWLTLSTRASFHTQGMLICTQTNSLITLQIPLSPCGSTKLFIPPFDVYLSVNTLRPAMTAAAPHQLAQTGYHNVQHWARSKEKIQREVNEGKKTGRQTVCMKNDICWCRAPFSPPGNNLVFQENKFKDQSGRVRQILEGAITMRRKEQGKGISLPLTSHRGW